MQAFDVFNVVWIKLRWPGYLRTHDDIAVVNAAVTDSEDCSYGCFSNALQQSECICTCRYQFCINIANKQNLP